MGILTNLSNRIKGTIGELKVKKKLTPLLFGRVYHRLINNLLLLDENGKSHQIDHIEIRENGIFCIETKNYIKRKINTTRECYICTYPPLEIVDKLN